MSTKPSTARHPKTSVAAYFRQQIEARREEGAEAGDLTLRLTNMDANRLKRDPEVAVADINFAQGVMHFLGVKVVEGGVPESSLELNEPAA